MSARAPVVFVMIDGLRPDAIDAAGCTTLQALRGLSHVGDVDHGPDCAGKYP